MQRPQNAVISSALALVGLCAATRVFAAPPVDTDRILADLGQDKAHAALLADPLNHARSALDRARALDRGGDATHAVALRAVAVEWLDLSRDMVRAADLEAKAAHAEQELDELHTKLTREHALLEETVGRRGRAREALEQLAQAPPNGATNPSVVAAPERERETPHGGPVANTPTATAPHAAETAAKPTGAPVSPAVAHTPAPAAKPGVATTAIATPKSGSAAPGSPRPTAAPQGAARP